MKTIPIFFACNDDAYLPYLDVAISSLVDHTSKENNYQIIILNSYFTEEGKQKLRKHNRENVNISFFDISEMFNPYKDKLPNAHFAQVIYFRLFIEKAFPQYSKAIYLDSDVIILTDIAELYDVDLGGNLLAAAFEQNTDRAPMFTNYVKDYLGIPPKSYFNSGVLVMNLDEFRKVKVLDTFIHMLNTYNFDCIAVDQEYLNVICHGKVKYLPTGWNKHSFPEPPEGKLKICHYALSNKPWHYADTINGEYFWEYAKKSQFYDDILKEFENFGEDGKRRDAEKFQFLLKAIDNMKNSERTFKKLWFDKK